MTALAEALLAAQRQAIGALGKAFVSGAFDDDPSQLIAELDRIGCKDSVDQNFLMESLMLLRSYGASAPKAAQAEPQKSNENEPATDAQVSYISKLADERGTTAPDYQLTKQNASKVIEQLKAGTYNPDDWQVPF